MNSKSTIPAPDRSATFPSLLRSVRSADQDFEWYPTTDRMIAVVARHLDKSRWDASTARLLLGTGDAGGEGADL